ncbi:MAG: alpha/beta fold hydrolase [Symploca sp. SIO3E6]|nr:alpha/beta fold hydrolase [Caldora sp. SIO3E6]
MKFVYLHGFASSPESRKAVYLHQAFANLAISLEVPDLNQGDFSHLTITRQLRQLEAMLPEAGIPVTLIGSSLGGLTAAWLGQKRSLIQRLVLLAPAFGFLDHWLPQLGEAQWQQWQESGYLPIYHYREKRSLPLHYHFVEDARHYQSEKLWRVVPTLILHGLHDETIPIEASRQYARVRSWVQLIELESDHSLSNVMPEIWQEIQKFCHLV